VGASGVGKFGSLVAVEDEGEVEEAQQESCDVDEHYNVDPKVRRPLETNQRKFPLNQVNRPALVGKHHETDPVIIRHIRIVNVGQWLVERCFAIDHDFLLFVGGVSLPAILRHLLKRYEPVYHY